MAVQIREKRGKKKSSEEKKMPLKSRAPEKELEEKQEFMKFANKKLIKELLTIIDDFERAMGSVKDKEELRVIEDSKMICKKGIALGRSRSSLITTRDGQLMISQTWCANRDGR